MSLVGRVRAEALNAVRRGDPVCWTPDYMGFGNHLYLLLRAEQEPGMRVLVTDKLRPWLDVMPALRPLAVERADVPFTARRAMPWREHMSAHDDESRRGYTQAERDDFVRERVLAGLDPESFLTRPRRDDLLVVNVRRGDYFSDPEILAEFGYDVVAYTETAVRLALGAEPDITAVRFVSDDIDWVAEQLVPHLAGLLGDRPVELADPAQGMVADFFDVACARHLVIPNSTFSYWAAYVSTVLHGDNHASIWAPRFFIRGSNGGRSWQLDPRWSVVEDIPGGWDSVLATPGRTRVDEPPGRA